nr:hypothetical protein [Kibdelosporangium sp. MJ126-NF4]CEL17089.1 hypothetical protein [Kibdelosporangium sp. MJ126-NF4]CTQ91682.1 hypothetical protein [Kibdelosporangium sp. MJ126-NF4]
MSPVSRGRKKKTTKKKKYRSIPPPAARYQDVVLPPFPDLPPFADLAESMPEWFYTGITNVLGNADVLLTASTARQVEQATAELLGAELHRATSEHEDGLYFSEWFKHLAEAAAQADRETTARLLVGMTMLAPSNLRTHAESALDRVAKHLPDWLRDLDEIEAVGDVWKMADVYGARIALIASYVDSGDLPGCYLFDIQADVDPIALIAPGLFDDLDQAAEAWRAAVGETAMGAEPVLVHSPDDLEPLGYLPTGDDILGILGDETRAAMDNWFRTSRRLGELEWSLDKRGELLIPSSGSLHHGFDIEPLVTEFTAWYRDKHGAAPDSDVVRALATDWAMGVLPQLWHSVSPPRVAAQVAMFADDWAPDNPLTARAKAVFPDWVRWNGEQSDLPEHLIEQAVASAVR